MSGTHNRSSKWLRSLGALSLGFSLLLLFAILFGRGVMRFDAPEEFWAQKGELDSVAVERVGGDSLYDAYQLTLVSDAGYRLRAYLRAPRQEGKWPALILLGGVRTGKMAAELVTPASPHVIVGLDYPWDGPTQLTTVQFLRNIFALRRAMLLTPSAIFLAIDYLERRDDVAPGRIILTGASFGAQLAAVAGALDPRVGPVVLCYGGGDYSLLLYGSLKLKPAWLRRAVARAGAWFLAPLEPLNYVAGIAPDPLIIINGLNDDRIPYESVYLLYETAGHPKRLVWLDEGHISSRNEALLQRVLQTAVYSLDELRRTAQVRGPTEPIR